MKKIKTLALVAALTLSISVLGGCAEKFDPVAYIKATLDNSYKNDASEAVEQKIATEEEANQVYEEGIQAEVDALVSSAAMYGGTVSDETKETYTQLFKDLYSQANYEVKDAKKNSDGSYDVTVECSQMQIFANAYAALQEMANNGELASTDADAIYAALAQCLQAQLDAGVEFANPTSETVKITLNGNVYTPSTADLTNLTYALFDLQAMGQ